ncbi:unnamed protein product [marine sediment metagenome]|uniref:Uncharacterized protein n=1 Tax=marine sediment metagenome TaxID=412755 RepID=X1F324_9ZZZZ
MSVEGTFRLQNRKDAVTAVVGYPRGMLEKSLDDFKVTVDGKPVEVNSQAGGRAKGPRMMRPAKREPGKPVKSAYQFDGPYPEWKTFNVKFAAKGQRELVVTYDVKPAELETVDNGKVLAYIYTMKTGATWKENIEKAVIEVRLNGISAADLLTVTPKKYTRKGDLLTWAFKDFKPTQDIEITFRPSKTQARR